MLALVFSILIEVLFFVGFKSFGTSTVFGTLTNFWSRSFIYFHWPAIIFTDYCVTMDIGSVWQDAIGIVIFISVALFEWWIILFAGIWSFRYFSKKSALSENSLQKPDLKEIRSNRSAYRSQLHHPVQKTGGPFPARRS